MERLTGKYNGRYFLKHCYEKNPCSSTGGMCICEECDFAYKAIEKLGKFEDLEEQGNKTYKSRKNKMPK